MVREYPLDRDARSLLVRELARAGKQEEADQAAAELVALAPNATRFRELLTPASRAATVAAKQERPRRGTTEGAVFDKVSARAEGFCSGLRVVDPGAVCGGEAAAYAAYRRSALEIVRQTASRRFAGGPAVMLLHDQVVQLEDDGRVTLYVHKVIRVLNRDGIEKYGEVTLPAGADLLELRTVKQDGAVVEPEFSASKSSVSMPALAPGDAIEQEYVVRYPNGGAGEHPGAFTYTFGSFAMPVLYARFVVISSTRATATATAAGDPAPACGADCGAGLRVVSTAGAPPATSRRSGAMDVRVWEQENIPQSTKDVSSPRRRNAAGSPGAGGARARLAVHARPVSQPVD